MLAAGYLIMRNGNEHTLDFYTTPQPTDYVKKERKKKKATDGEKPAAAPVIYDAVPDEPPVCEKPPHVIYRSCSGYGWEET